MAKFIVGAILQSIYCLYLSRAKLFNKFLSSGKHSLFSLRIFLAFLIVPKMCFCKYCPQKERDGCLLPNEFLLFIFCPFKNNNSCGLYQQKNYLKISFILFKFSNDQNYLVFIKLNQNISMLMNYCLLQMLLMIFLFSFGPYY